MTPESVLAEGKECFNAEMYDDAAEHFERAMRMRRDYVEAIEWLAHTYEKQNKIPQAIQCWNSLLLIRDLPDEKRNLARQEINTIQLRAQFGAEVTPEMLLEDGKKYFEKKQYDMAGTRFLQALQLKNDYADAVEWVAYTYERKEMIPNAIAAWEAYCSLGDVSKEKQEQAKQRIQKIRRASGSRMQ